MKADELRFATRVPHALPAGARLRAGLVIECVGGGSTGHLYRVLDELGSVIAVREYFPPALAEREDGAPGMDGMVRPQASLEAAFEAGLKLFEQDGWQMSVQDHPGLLKVHQVWSELGTSYLSMPWCDGRTLEQVLRASPAPPSQPQLVDWLRAMADALGPIHRRRGLHGHLSPSQVMRLDSGRLLLMEFSRLHRAVAGDPRDIERDPYAALECGTDARSGPMGPWTDIYALAAILYFALRGRPPQAPVHRVAYDAYEPLTQCFLAGDYTEEFLLGIDSGLALRPRSRPRSLPAFLARCGLHERRARPRPAGESLLINLAKPEATAPPGEPAEAAVPTPTVADIEIDGVRANAASVAEPAPVTPTPTLDTFETPGPTFADRVPPAAGPAWAYAHVGPTSSAPRRRSRARSRTNLPLAIAGWTGLGIAVAFTAIGLLDIPLPGDDAPSMRLAFPVPMPDDAARTVAQPTPDAGASSPIPDPLEPTAAGPARALPADLPASAPAVEASSTAAAETAVAGASAALPDGQATGAAASTPVVPGPAAKPGTPPGKPARTEAITPAASAAERVTDLPADTAPPLSPCPGLLARQYIGRPLDDAEREQLKLSCR